jgi:hypothetical protein
MKGCKLSKGVFEKKSKNLPHFDGKKRVKLAIIRALVLLCHKCIVKFEKNLLLSSGLQPNVGGRHALATWQNFKNNLISQWEN